MSFGRTFKKLFAFTFKWGVIVGVFGVCLAASSWLYVKNVVMGEVVATPDLLGMTIEDARSQVEDMGLVLAIEEQQVHSGVIAKDRVYLQTPRPGREIKTGRLVEITISAGPEEKLIPDLSGETLSFSRTLLKGVGKEVEVETRIPTSLEPKGRVLAQHPEPGADPGLNKELAVLVSDGSQEPYFVTPNLVGRDFSQVKQFLDRHEFRMIVKYQAEDSDLGSVVLHQAPAPGYPINKSQTITLIVNEEI